MKALGLESQLEFIHFGLTSQDINNTAIPLSLKEGIQEVYTPMLEKLIEKIMSSSTNGKTSRCWLDPWSSGLSYSIR